MWNETLVIGVALLFVAIGWFIIGPGSSPFKRLQEAEQEARESSSNARSDYKSRVMSGSEYDRRAILQIAIELAIDRLHISEAEITTFGPAVTKFRGTTSPLDEKPTYQVELSFNGNDRVPLEVTVIIDCENEMMGLQPL